MGNHREGGRIAIILVSLVASGTERRMSFVFDRLARRSPGRFLLIVNRSLYDRLRSAGFRFGDGAEVHVLERRFSLDRKTGADAPLLVNIARLMTLLQYRQEVTRVLRSRNIRTIQVFLEMVPVIGLWPIGGVARIASLVSHLPKYYDGHSVSSRTLVLCLQTYDRIDSLYEYITSGLSALGIRRERISAPAATCVDHERFHPEPKNDLITFTGRALAFKHPELLLRAIEHVVTELDRVDFRVLGDGPMMKQLISETERRGLRDHVHVGYLADPSPIVNRSRVHVCVEEYDNAPNQSLLEGMASGCAIVASDVGRTARVVTPDVGLLVPLEAQAIGQAVLQLMSDPERCQKMGQAAREKILRNYRVDGYIDYLLRLYQEVGSG